MIEKRKKDFREHCLNILPFVFGGILCGGFVGLAVFFFKLGAEHIEDISSHIYTHLSWSSWQVYPFLLLVALLGVGMFLLHRMIPDVKGGGIPESMGILKGFLNFNWLKTLIGTIVGSFMSFFGGVPLGSEGPSVLIGTCLGKFCGTVYKDKDAWGRFFMTGGAGAGFAVATGSPLSAILFVLEEIHRRVSPLLLVMISSSVLTAAMVNDFLCRAFGIDPMLFNYGLIQQIELSHLGYIVLLAVMLALAVTAFDLIMAWFNAFVKRAKNKVLKCVFLVLVFVITAIVGISMPESLHSGRSVVKLLLEAPSMRYVLILLALRVVFMLMTTSTGMTGGLFIPTLAIGAVVGSIYGKILVYIGLPENMYVTILMLSMIAFMGGTMRIPLTATVFFIESTGQFTNILYISLVIFTVSFAAEAINRDSFYERNLEHLKDVYNRGRTPQIRRYSMVVSEGSFICGKALKDVILPPTTIILSIAHTGDFNKIMDEGGDQVLRAGDSLVVQSEVYRIKEYEQYLRSLVGADPKQISLEE